MSKKGKARSKLEKIKNKNKKLNKKIQKTYSTDYLNFWLRGFTSLFLQSSEAFGSKRPCSYSFVFVTSSQAPTDSIPHRKKINSSHCIAPQFITSHYGTYIALSSLYLHLHCPVSNFSFSSSSSSSSSSALKILLNSSS